MAQRYEIVERCEHNGRAITVQQVLPKQNRKRIPGTWVRTTSRKPHTCILCAGLIFVGENAFRPATSSADRRHRICQACAIVGRAP